MDLWRSRSDQTMVDDDDDDYRVGSLAGDTRYGPVVGWEYKRPCGREIAKSAMSMGFVFVASLYKRLLTHCSGRVTQICIFNTVKLGTSASSP